MTQSVKISQPTVRIHLAAKKKIDLLQAQTRLSQPALLDRAIDLLERQLLSEQLEADFAAIAEDDKTLHAYLKATSDFDNASSDRLPRTKK